MNLSKVVIAFSSDMMCREGTRATSSTSGAGEWGGTSAIIWVAHKIRSRCRTLPPLGGEDVNRPDQYGYATNRAFNFQDDNEWMGCCSIGLKTSDRVCARRRL